MSRRARIDDPVKARLERYFEFRELGTNWRTEILAGATTFVTMAYIIFVNPAILHETGMPLAAGDRRHVRVRAFGSVLMGVLARYPIALAPGMGLNAYFTYTVVKGMGVPWQTALGAVFLSGCRVPDSDRRGRAADDRVGDSVRAVRRGRGRHRPVHRADRSAQRGNHHGQHVDAGDHGQSAKSGDAAGARRTAADRGAAGVPGSRRDSDWDSRDHGAGRRSSGWCTGSRSLIRFATSPPRRFIWIFGARCATDWWRLFSCSLFVDLFDNIGTLVAVGKQARLFDEMHQIPRINRILYSRRSGHHRGIAGRHVHGDQLHRERGGRGGGWTHGSDGDRDGAAFFVALFIAPVAGAIPNAATAPALIVVGSLMIAHAAEIPWSDPVVAIPAFLTIVTIPLTFSIANGLAFGFTAYTLLKIARGEFRGVSWLVYALTILFIARFVYLSTG